MKNFIKIILMILGIGFLTSLTFNFVNKKKKTDTKEEVVVNDDKLYFVGFKHDIRIKVRLKNPDNNTYSSVFYNFVFPIIETDTTKYDLELDDMFDLTEYLTNSGEKTYIVENSFTNPYYELKHYNNDGDSGSDISAIRFSYGDGLFDFGKIELLNEFGEWVDIPTTTGSYNFVLEYNFTDSYEYNDYLTEDLVFSDNNAFSHN